ncbi:MAG: response regulator [Methylobacter sp.]|nr:response regulator [Methylobacter sp.]MDP2099023.1 response regulator [Methylobacter sp.]MDP2427618.1 response regulator [Methylobacter sp.]MDP3056851.1 response regulator [Methylobacter sp.]MDP3363510.1 response regulator [Methylobacter sp.]
MAKTILIVDDSATMLMSVKSNLEIAGFTVETAEDGVKALTKLKGGVKPDLIITDINMPNMNGIELIQNTRALTGFRFMPILVLTTESQQARRDEAKKLGATGWLVKPVGGADLLKVIKQVLPGA